MARFNLEDAAAKVYEKAELMYKGSEINSTVLEKVVDKYFSKTYSPNQLQTIKDYFKEQETMWSELEAGEEKVESKEVKAEGKKVKISSLGELEDISDDFVSYKSFAENFGDLVIIKSPYDKNYYVFNAEKLDFAEYIFFTSSAASLEGWLYGAVQANNGRFNDLKKGVKVTESKEVPYDNTTTKKCPLCGKEYTDYPALSRKDNKTYICSDCGVAEALEDYYKNIKKEDKEVIYDTTMSVATEIKDILDRTYPEKLTTKLVQSDGVVGLRVNRKNKEDLVVICDEIIKLLRRKGIEEGDYEIELRGNSLFIAVEDKPLTK